MRAIGVLVAILMVGSVPAHADENDQKIADQKFIEGRELMNKGQAKEACAKFHEAQQKAQESVAIQLNLGLCYEKQGLIASALKWYKKTLTDASASTDANVKEYSDAANEATGRLGPKAAKLTITYAAGTEGVEVFVNGTCGCTDDLPVRTERNVIVDVDAGERTIEARAPGKVTMTKKLVVKDGQGYSHQVTALEDAPDPEGLPRTKRRLLGVGIAVGVTGVAGLITGLKANSIADKFAMTGDVPGENPGRTMKILGVAFVGAAVLGVAAGGYFFFTKPRLKRESMTAIAPVLTTHDAGVAVFHRF